MCEVVPNKRLRISDSKPLCIDMTKQTVPTPRATPMMVIQVATEMKKRPEWKYRRAIKLSMLMQGARQKAQYNLFGHSCIENIRSWHWVANPFKRGLLCWQSDVRQFFSWEKYDKERKFMTLIEQVPAQNPQSTQNYLRFRLTPESKHR